MLPNSQFDDLGHYHRNRNDLKRLDSNLWQEYEGKVGFAVGQLADALVDLDEGGTVDDVGTEELRQRRRYRRSWRQTIQNVQTLVRLKRCWNWRLFWNGWTHDKMEKCFSAQCHKTVHGHNLLVVLINLNICPWQAFPAWFNVCGLGQEPTLQVNNMKGVYTG